MNKIDRRKFIKLGAVFVAGASGLINFESTTEIKNITPLKITPTISFEEWQESLLRQIAASYEVPYDILVRDYESS